MKFFEMLADFFMSPVEEVIKWIDQLAEGLKIAWQEFCNNAALGITQFVVEGVAVFMVCYLMYCAFRVMCTSKDETFSDYLNKYMLAGIGYFFAKVGGRILLGGMGVRLG